MNVATLSFENLGEGHRESTNCLARRRGAASPSDRNRWSKDEQR